MKTIQLLYAENVVSRSDGNDNQRIGFCIGMENLGYEKQVEIHWGPRNGPWQVLPAHFVRSCGGRHEIWEADMRFFAGPHGHLPGDISFAVHGVISGADYWDSNEGENYTIKSDAGVLVPAAFPFLAIKVQPQLQLSDAFLPVTVAVHQSLEPQKVFVHWTNDHWRTINSSDCFFWRHHWEKTHASNAPNPNAYGTSLWVTHLPVSQAYRIEYAIGCETPELTVWDNNCGENYVARHDRLKVLTLNLHCCQEENQDTKLSTIAKAIDDHDVDIVCLQEVAEPWEGGIAARELNTAKIIRERLRHPYNLVSDWSHRGFNIYREGCAILTKHEIVVRDSGYVSSSHDPNSINARKIVMAQVNVPQIGFVNVFSAHLSWWSDGFREQFENLRAWANEKHTRGVVGTLLLGDFNTKTGSEGYHLATGGNEFEDQYLKAQRASSGLLTPASQAELASDGRIDYIFLKKGSALEVKAAKELFTDSAYGRVSDHIGYYAEFEPI